MTRLSLATPPSIKDGTTLLFAAIASVYRHLTVQPDAGVSIVPPPSDAARLRRPTARRGDDGTVAA